MIPISDAFEYEYGGSDLIYGRGSIERLGQRLDDAGLDRALVVTGSNVGANPDVMEPVRSALGDRLCSVFDETTPEKLGVTVFDGIEVMRREPPDVLVGLGGGSSLDVARQMSVLAADGRSLSDLRAAARDGDLAPPTPDGPLVPVIVVPTTFAGADVSSGGSVEILAPEESPTGQPIRISGSAVPEAIFYDPNLFETTPMAPLAGSAMNGFDKGIETMYARTATPITDATAIRGLRLLREALPKLPDAPRAMERAVVGIILVQFERKTSIVHAFGHGFSQRYDLQQGVIHAVVVPHVLRYLFDRVDADRELLAEGLGIESDATSDEDLSTAIIEEVAAVRDALALPTRLREVDVIREDDVPAIARAIVDDAAMANAPDGLDPNVDEIESVLRDAW